jgi:hypothetical protein
MEGNEIDAPTPVEDLRKAAAGAARSGGEQ